MIIKNIFKICSLLLIIDGTYLYLLMPFYKKNIGFLLRKKILLFPVLCFYILYSVAFYILIAHDFIHEKYSFNIFLLKSFVFGLISYGTFNLTNYAIIKDYPLNVVFVDTLYGAISALIIFYIFSKL